MAGSVWSLDGERVNFKVERGATFAETIRVDNAWTVTAAKLQIRPVRGSSIVWLTISDADGIHIANHGDHVILGLTIPHTTTGALNFGSRDSGYYDLLVTLSDGRRVRVIEGTAMLSREVTV